MASQAPFRRLHGLIAPVVLTPLLLTVCTGMAYRLLNDWAGLSRDQTHVLMVLHEGEWLGSPLKSVYVLLNGLGLLWMLATGAGMLVQKWSKTARRAPAAQFGTGVPVQEREP
ncbi:peptidase [Cyanobium sp. Morenito 9A2]|uniref:peptidase n=1 Tax=Cyanobium sp. Morenito 9A2 TaxID=2823718 RepID=UPI0020CF4274|nr:peptidase [Cyanobium sp. Morenito 9A2]